MQLIQPTVKDARTVGAVHSTAWKQTYSDIFLKEFLSQDTPEKRAQEFIDSCVDSDILYYIVYEEKTPVGIIKLDWASKPCELLSLYILQEYRGKGIGQKVMGFLKEEFGKFGMRLWVLEKNIRARRFYEMNGFRDTGEARTISRGESYTQLEYELHD